MAHSHDPTDPHVVRARQIADVLDSADQEQTLHEQFVAEWKAWEAEDPTRTMAAFDRAIGRGNDYTGRLVRFVTGSAQRGTPFSDGQAERATRKVLREGDAKQIRGILEDLPEDAVGRVASEVARVQQDPRYRVAREEYDRADAEKTPQQRHREQQDRARSIEDTAERMAKATAPLAAADIVEAIEEATDYYRDLIEQRGVTEEVTEAIGVALELLNREHEVAIGVVSLG